MKKILSILIVTGFSLLPIQAISECSSTPVGYSFLGELNDHRYYLSEANFNHAQASAEAAAQGGYMASIVEGLENEFLSSRINKIVRIGLSDGDTEGFLKWDSGEPFRLNNIRNENNDENDFANMNFWNGGWEMENKFVARPYILEKECGGGTNVCPVPVITSTETTPTDPVGIFVRWNAVAEADSYSVEYTDTNTNMTNSKTTDFSNTQVVDGIDLGQNYNIKVKSICGTQQSAFSNTVNHTTAEGQADVGSGFYRSLQVVPPGAPTLISIDHAIINSGSIDATFEVRYVLSTDNQFSADDVVLSLANRPVGDPYIVTLACCFSSNEIGGVHTIPGGLQSGDYFVLGVVDPEDKVAGVGGVAVRQVTIDPAPASLPNLFAGLIQFDQPVESPSTTQINYDIRNNGNTGTNGSFNVEFYLSPNDSDPANDILLATETISQNIAQGESAVDSVSVNIPPNLTAGRYRFIVVTDSDNQIPEQDESNSAIRIFDLIEGDTGSGNECPGSIQGYTVMGELDGSKYYLSDDRKNWNQASALTRTHDGYLASINNAAENTFLKELINEIVLVGLTDKVSEGTFVWDSGEGLTYNNITGTNNSSNNDYSNMNFWNGGWDFDNEQVARRYIMEVECSGDGGGGGDGKPDLNVSNLSAIPSGAPGQVLNYTFNLNNFEPVTASESYRIGMYVSNDSILSSDDILAGIVPTGNTPEGTISNVPGAITVPAGLTPGPYFLIVKADIDNSVDETIESNNLATRNFSVTSAPGLSVDMELSMTVDKPVHQAWTNFTFTITATNKGTSRANGVEVTWQRSDRDNMAYVDVEFTKGNSSGWTGSWKDLNLDPGESAQLEVTYFFKTQTTPSSVFAAVTATIENDIDSTPTPGIPTDFIVREDDEAKATVANP